MREMNLQWRKLRNSRARQCNGWRKCDGRYFVFQNQSGMQQNDFIFESPAISNIFSFTFVSVSSS